MFSSFMLCFRELAVFNCWNCCKWTRKSSLYERFDSDGGFIAHNATKDTYPAPHPTKKVNFNGNGAAITDANHNTGNNIYNLPAYNDSDCIIIGSTEWNISDINSIYKPSL
ncbi:hypothetical protein ACF0H5_019022 [Mactra antiquata]